ncbi:MAG: hypothetical protein NZ561_04110, partial [Phycisphaerae bacterium]|nr:hypothetical protein [Phycisphaerae bacterium]
MTSMTFCCPEAAPSRRRRGSVLILVVALLVLLALVGTAYLTTTRLDRTAAVTHTVNTQKELVMESVVNYVQANVLSDILDPGALDLITGRGATIVRPPSSHMTPLAYRPIDMPLVDAFLGDRLPYLQWTRPIAGTGQSVPRPVWRSLSWPAFGAADFASGWLWEAPDANAPQNPSAPVQNHTPPFGAVEFVRPYEDGVIYKMGEVVFVPGEGGTCDYYIRTGNSLGTASNAATAPRGGLPVYPLPPALPLWERCDPKQYFSYAPTTVERNGTNYPAMYLINNYTIGVWGAGFNRDRHMPYIMGPVLAADADGDGIADSLYRRLPLGEIAGLSYFMAMRVVDHNSAINLNTAWARDADMDLTPFSNANRIGLLGSWGFFPSNVGLREMMFSWNRPNALGEPEFTYGLAAPSRYYIDSGNIASPTYEPLAEITRHNLYRFGFSENAITLTPPPPLGLRPASDPPALSGNPSQRDDFTFRSQGEALFTQLARRPLHPGYGDNNLPAPDGSITLADAPLRWISLGTDGAALAYRGGVLVNLSNPPSPLEMRFSASVAGYNNLRDPSAASPLQPMDSLYFSAHNVRDKDPSRLGDMFKQSAYPLVASRDLSAGSLAGTNPIVDRWFDVNFNFDRWFDGPAGRFRLDNPSTPEGFYRSMRPLVVTSNPVSNVVGPRAGQPATATVPLSVADIGTDNTVS